MSRTVAVLAVLLVAAAPAHALDAHVRAVHADNETVVTDIEIGALVPKSLARVIEEGNALHLRLQAELWESRPAWDRLVYPALVRVLRIARAGAPATLSIADEAGVIRPAPEGSSRYSTTLALGRTDRIAAGGRYYVHLVATIGTIADRDADTFNDAVFGRESDGGSAVAFGRFVLRSMLQLSDYLQSVSSDTKGRVVPGSEILRR